MGTKPNPTNGTRCLECGQPLRGEALEGFCPRCLSRLAFGADTAAAGSANVATRSVGDYEFIEEIGRGGMGVVWKARQRSLNRIVALKFILTGSFASREFIERFHAEATAAARLSHPNIVPVHEMGEHEGHHYFSMDFIEGRSLAQLVRAEPPSPRQAARHLRLIAEAIHHAHQRGIVHRDLKPSNILVDAAGEPHITDFERSGCQTIWACRQAVFNSAFVNGGVSSKSWSVSTLVMTAGNLLLPPPDRGRPERGSPLAP